MFSVFKHSLSQSRGAIIGWGLTLAGLGMMFVPFFDVIAEDIETWETLLSVYPEELMAFFSAGASFTTPEGFLSLEYFSFMPLILGVYALQAGSGLLATDEESGVLDLIAAHPVSRSGLFWGRLLSFWLTLIMILTFGWAGVMFATTFSIMELDGALLMNAFVSLGALLVFLSGLALLLSMILPSRRSASMFSGIILVASFFITGLANLNEVMADVARFSPLNYYQGDSWMDGLNGEWLFGLAGFGVLFTLTAWWRFVRRDIRVGGEGGWKLKLPSIWPLKKSEA